MTNSLTTRAKRFIFGRENQVEDEFPALSEEEERVLELESLRKEVADLRANDTKWYNKYKEAADKYVDAKKTLAILQAFKELDSCAVPVEEHEKLKKRYDDLLVERRRELAVWQAPLEDVIDMVCCELLCYRCFARTMHVAGSAVMMARLMKYFHGDYSRPDQAHKRIQATSEAGADKIMALLEKRCKMLGLCFETKEGSELDALKGLRGWQGDEAKHCVFGDDAVRICEKCDYAQRNEQGSILTCLYDKACAPESCGHVEKGGDGTEYCLLLSGVGNPMRCPKTM
jgi:hypothetical protein